MGSIEHYVRWTPGRSDTGRPIKVTYYTGHSGECTPRGYLSTVKYTALLVRSATSCATETTYNVNEL